MAKVDDDLIELAAQELAFEMIELTCNEVDSLARALTMINDLCIELQSEIEASPYAPLPAETLIH
jgi:hypothetical protein